MTAKLNIKYNTLSHFDFPWVSVQHTYCLMPSPTDHSKQSVVLLVVSLFLLGCVVPSSVGTTVDIRRQSEENSDLSEHRTAKKTKKKKEGGGETSLGYVPLPLPGLLQIATPRN